MFGKAKKIRPSLTSYLLLSLLTLAKTLQAAALEEANDLSKLTELMQEKNAPLILAVESEHCNYCQRLKTEHLEPMVNSEEYLERVFIRTLDISGTDEILDLEGKTTTASDLAERYRAYLTPTLLFLNERGEEVAERMLGYNTPDFYGFYLDKAIATAAKSMNEKSMETSTAE